MPLDDTEQKDMQLKDLLEEQSAASISKKTNIAIEIVEKLLSKDFKTLMQPQALGALSIIEREYNVDLSALRKECKHYFAENAPDATQGLTVIRPIRQESSIFPKILVTVLLGLVAYGAWYLFSEYYHQKITHMDPPNIKSMNSTILQNEDASFTNIEAAEITGPSSTVNPAVQNTKAEEEKQTETNQVVTQEAASAGSEERNQTAPVDEAGASVESNGSAESMPSPVTRETITLLPRGVMWFNLFHLDSKKRSYFKRKNKFNIDVKENGWLFATENAKFAFIDNGVI